MKHIEIIRILKKAGIPYSSPRIKYQLGVRVTVTPASGGQVEIKFYYSSQEWSVKRMIQACKEILESASFQTKLGEIPVSEGGGLRLFVIEQNKQFTVKEIDALYYSVSGLKNYPLTTSGRINDYV